MDNKTNYSFQSLTQKTPYFNYHKFTCLLGDLNSKDYIDEWKFIEWIGETYNTMLSGFIEKQIKLFRNRCGIKIDQAEHSILKGIKLKSQLTKHNSTLLKSNQDLSLKKNLNTGDLKVIKSSDIHKIVIKNDESFTLLIPDVEWCKVILSADDIQKVDLLIYSNCVNFELENTDLYNRTDREELLEIRKLRDYHNQFKSKYKSKVESQKMASKCKNEFKQNFDKEVELSIKQDWEIIVNSIKESNDKLRRNWQSYEYIKEYSWENINCTLKLFDLFDNSNGSNDFMHSDPIDFKELKSIKSCVRFLAENIYSSYSHYWKIKAADKTDNKYIRSKIQERHNTILYLIRNCHLNYDKWKSYWRKQLCYLINETSKKNSVNIVDSVVGVYWGIRVNPALTRKFPFEIAYNIDSSLVRIRTILQWNEIHSLQFVKARCSPSFTSTAINVRVLLHFY